VSAWELDARRGALWFRKGDFNTEGAEGHGEGRKNSETQRRREEKEREEVQRANHSTKAERFSVLAK